MAGPRVTASPPPPPPKPRVAAPGPRATSRSAQPAAPGAAATGNQATAHGTPSGTGGANRRRGASGSRGAERAQRKPAEVAKPQAKMTAAEFTTLKTKNEAEILEAIKNNRMNDNQLVELAQTSLKSNVLKELAKKPNVDIRAAVAGNEQTPQTLLDNIENGINDPDKKITYALLGNKIVTPDRKNALLTGLTIDNLKTLISGKNVTAKTAALGELTRRAADPSHKENAAAKTEINKFDSVVLSEAFKNVDIKSLPALVAMDGNAKTAALGELTRRAADPSHKENAAAKTEINKFDAVVLSEAFKNVDIKSLPALVAIDGNAKTAALGELTKRAVDSKHSDNATAKAELNKSDAAVLSKIFENVDIKSLPALVAIDGNAKTAALGELTRRARNSNSVQELKILIDDFDEKAFPGVKPEARKRLEYIVQHELKNTGDLESLAKEKDSKLSRLAIDRLFDLATDSSIVESKPAIASLARLAGSEQKEVNGPAFEKLKKLFDGGKLRNENIFDGVFAPTEKQNIRDNINNRHWYNEDLKNAISTATPKSAGAPPTPPGPAPLGGLAPTGEVAATSLDTPKGKAASWQQSLRSFAKDTVDPKDLIVEPAENGKMKATNTKTNFSFEFDGDQIRRDQLPDFEKLGVKINLPLFDVIARGNVLNTKEEEQFADKTAPTAISVKEMNDFINQHLKEYVRRERLDVNNEGDLKKMAQVFNESTGFTRIPPEHAKAIDDNARNQASSAPKEANNNVTKDKGIDHYAKQYTGNASTTARQVLADVIKSRGLDKQIEFKLDKLEDLYAIADWYLYLSTNSPETLSAKYYEGILTDIKLKDAKAPATPPTITNAEQLRAHINSVLKAEDKKTEGTLTALPIIEDMGSSDSLFFEIGGKRIGVEQFKKLYEKFAGFKLKNPAGTPIDIKTSSDAPGFYVRWLIAESMRQTQPAPPITENDIRIKAAEMLHMNDSNAVSIDDILRVYPAVIERIIAERNLSATEKKATPAEIQAKRGNLSNEETAIKGRLVSQGMSEDAAIELIIVTAKASQKIAEAKNKVLEKITDAQLTANTADVAEIKSAKQALAEIKAPATNPSSTTPPAAEVFTLPLKLGGKDLKLTKGVEIEAKDQIDLDGGKKIPKGKKLKVSYYLPSTGNITFEAVSSINGNNAIIIKYTNLNYEADADGNITKIKAKTAAGPAVHH